MTEGHFAVGNSGTSKWAIQSRFPGFLRNPHELYRSGVRSAADYNPCTASRDQIPALPLRQTHDVYFGTDEMWSKEGVETGASKANEK